MGIQKVVFNFMVERGGKLSKSLLCTKPQKAVTSIKGLKYTPKQFLTSDVVEISKDAAIKRFEDIHDFKTFEKYFMLSNGKYNKNALDIVTKFEDKDGFIPYGIAREVIHNLNFAKIDKNAFMELRNIYLNLVKSSKVDIRKGHIFFKNALNNGGSFNKRALDDAKNIIDKYKSSRNSITEIPFALAFKDYKNIQSIEELSIVEKNDLLTKLISNPYLKKSKQVFDDISILPKSENEYKALISKLIKQTSVEVKALPLAQRQVAIKNLEELTNADVKTVQETIGKLYPEIGKIGDETVNILQKVMKDERFALLPQEDKLTAQLAVILRNSSSIHGIKDVEQSAFNAFYLAEKLGLPHENKLKLYALVKNQNLYKEADANNITMALVEKAGCELRHENSYKMYEIINDAKGIETKNISIIKTKLEELYKSRTLINHADYSITQTKLPKASQFIVNGDSVKKVNKDGIENIVVYFDLKKPIMYKDENGIIKELKREDVYNYCHATNNLDSVELASRPNSNYAMSSSFMNPTKGTHHLFNTEGVMVHVPKGNSYYDRVIADTDGTGFGKTGDATKFMGYWGDMQYNVSDKCAEFGRKQISELSKESAAELRKSLDTMLSKTLYGENISFHPEPIGVFFEGPYKGYLPIWGRPEPKNYEQFMTLRDKVERYLCHLMHKEYKPKFYKIDDVPLEHRTYAHDKDFAIFHLGY